MSGWIKLHRQTLDNPVIMKDAEHLALWCYLLLKATHDSHDVLFGGSRVTLKPGELITGRKKLAAELGMSESKIERVLATFAKDGQIEQRSDRQSRVIKLKRWDQYQLSEQRSNNDRTTIGQRSDTIQECKNVKNEKNGRKTDVPPDVIDEHEAELRQLIPFASRVLGHPKTFTADALRCWKARRSKRSPRELAQAFDNLSNEPDLWKIKNNGWRPLTWWLEKDSRIEEMLNCHLKVPTNRKPLHVAG